MTLPILLVLAALCLLVLEVFVVSLGVLSLAAAVLGIYGIVLGFGHSPEFGWSLVGTVVVLGPVSVWGAFKALPHFKFTRGFYLRRPDMTAQERHAAAPARKDLTGAVGETSSPLRPAGTARFGDEVLSVMTEGTAVPRGAKVRVVEVTGNRIVVEALSPNPQGNNA